MPNDGAVGNVHDELRFTKSEFRTIHNFGIGVNHMGHRIVIISGVSKLYRSQQIKRRGKVTLYGHDVSALRVLVSFQIFDRKGYFGTIHARDVCRNFDIVLREFSANIHLNGEILGLRELGIALSKAFLVSIAYIGIRETEWIYRIYTMFIRGRSGYWIQ